MIQFDYRTIRLESQPERDIDLDVEPMFEELQEEGWEYVSGPVIPNRVPQCYIFTIRRRRVGRAITS